MRTNEQTRSRQGRGTRGDGRTPSALRAARGEGPGPGGPPRGPAAARQGNGCTGNPAPARSGSEAQHRPPPLLPVHTHTRTLTHSHGGPDPDSGGKTGSPAPDGQAGPSQGRTGAPTSQAPGPVPAEGAGRAGGWGGTGRGSRAPGGLSPPSPRAGRRSHDLETDLELSRRTLGPFSQPGLQWPSCLQCHECIVSFINFKYKQNKNHIFLRQQQFSR